jgi:primosomal protein N' (replication factor Y)
VLDEGPIVTEELLGLAQQTADYYLAPIGEVIRSMVPSDLPPWGDQQVWLSNAALMLEPGSADEALVIEYLAAKGRAKMSDLIRDVEVAELPELITRLSRSGRIRTSRGRRDSGRFVSAVELASGDFDDLLDRCGRSSKGRAVVEYLAELSRPSTVKEVCSAVGCGSSVVKRLTDLGVLRGFTQVSKLPLAHHRMASEPFEPVTLRPDQAEASDAILNCLDGDEYHGFLLAGITGSGKTEVYLRAIDRIFEQGGAAIVLVPEIALVPALAGAARSRYGSATALLHSALSKSERHQEWERIQRGEARVVVGPRSAVFAPVRDLRLIVVDEEQDPSYKQDHVPRYHARDLAILRAHRSGSTAVLVSATPSLETRHNSEIGKLETLLLTRRVGRAELPEGILVDLRSEAPPSRPGEIHFTDPLKELVASTLDAGDQVILLRNRRGYSPVLLCRACGYDFRCEDCGLPRTYHLKERRLRCHYCGASNRAPEHCLDCGEEALDAIGAGTERVEERFRELFPGVPVSVLDRDASRRGQATAVLETFGRGDSRVLIGTQMVSKGHHFPSVALTGVLLADTYLGFPDFRAVEKTYNLLTQLAGRAGRGERPGKVVIQTYHPEHYAIQAALAHDDSKFASEEMRFRRMFHYPPFTRMVQILLRDSNRNRALNSIELVSRSLESHPLARGVRIAGPAPAPFERLRGQWRFQLLLRHTSGNRLRALLAAAMPKSVSSDLVIDVDPYELL